MTEKEYIEKLEKANQYMEKIKNTTRRNFQDMVNLLTSVISLSSPFLGGHLRRVAEVSKELAAVFTTEKDLTYAIYYAGLLHDIGLIGLAEPVVSASQEDFSPTDRAVYLRHPETGENIVKTVYDLGRIAGIIRSHHEALDGSGFPDGLVGEAIPLGARIIRLINDYDNLLYKTGLSAARALALLQDQGGLLYDPEILEQFGKYLRTRGIATETGEQTILLKELKEGQFLLDDIYLENGMLLIPRGVFINAAKMAKIRSFASLLRPDQPLRIKL